MCASSRIWAVTTLGVVVTILGGISLAGCGGSGASSLPQEVVVLGISALEWDRIDALLEAGELPNFRRIIDGGARADPRAPDPLVSATLWTSVQTGLNPRQHGVMGPLEDLPNGQRSLARSGSRNHPTVWQMLGVNDRTVAVVGFPVTWPAEILNGFVVSNAVTPTRWTDTEEDTFDYIPGTYDTYPKGLYKEIQDRIVATSKIRREDASRFFVLKENEFEMIYDRPLGSIFARENPMRDFAMTFQADLSYLAVTNYLWDTYHPDNVACFLELPLALQPVYWYFVEGEPYQVPDDSRRRFKETVNEGYRWVDEVLGDILERMGPRSTLIVISEHGFGTSFRPSGDGREEPYPDAHPDAVLILYGHAIRPGVTVDNTRITDVVPTLLALNGTEIAKDLEGNVIRAAIEPAFLEAHPLLFRETYNDELDRDARYEFQATPQEDPALEPDPPTEDPN